MCACVFVCMYLCARVCVDVRVYINKRSSVLLSMSLLSQCMHHYQTVRYLVLNLKR